MRERGKEALAVGGSDKEEGEGELKSEFYFASDTTIKPNRCLFHITSRDSNTNLNCKCHGRKGHKRQKRKKK